MLPGKWIPDRVERPDRAARLEDPQVGIIHHDPLCLGVLGLPAARGDCHALDGRGMVAPRRGWRGGREPVRTLGNILWHVPFLGFLTAAFYWLLGLLLTLLVVTAPLGLGLMEFGKFLLAPFGNEMVSKSDLDMPQNPVWRAYSTLVMLVYLPFGVVFVVLNAIQVFALCFSIVGIPVALVIAKSLGTVLNPVNKVCVPSEVAEEMARRNARAEIDRRRG